MSDEPAYVIAQLSDIHCGDSRFDPVLARDVVDEVNRLEPDLVAVPGDLTERGYPEQFEEAYELISAIECPNKIVVPGNHDARNVGFLHYDAMFGPRFSNTTLQLPGPDGSLRLVGADTSKPDLNQGELGRQRHLWLYEALGGGESLKVLVMHHHLVGVPGTGRERNILWDAGDLLEILSECGCDLVLCGHKHVPYVWEMNGMVLSTSGTACTHRTRGRTPPSFSVVRVDREHIEVSMRNVGSESGRTFTARRRAYEDRKPSGRRRGRLAAVAGASLG